MRIKGTITIKHVSPTERDLIGIYFTCEDHHYVWQTNSWKHGNELCSCNEGEEYKVSFTIQPDGRNVKNLRIIN